MIHHSSSGACDEFSVDKFLSASNLITKKKYVYFTASVTKVLIVFLQHLYDFVFASTPCSTRYKLKIFPFIVPFDTLEEILI